MKPLALLIALAAALLGVWFASQRGFGLGGDVHRDVPPSVAALHRHFAQHGIATTVRLVRIELAGAFHRHVVRLGRHRGRQRRRTQCVGESDPGRIQRPVPAAVDPLVARRSVVAASADDVPQLRRGAGGSTGALTRDALHMTLVDCRRRSADR
jgi:hypothetical protein